MCNECGNCEVFCPHTGDPAKDKPTLFWSTQALEESANIGFVYLNDGRVRVRDIDGNVFEAAIDDEKVSHRLRVLMSEVKKSRDYIVM